MGFRLFKVRNSRSSSGVTQRLCVLLALVVVGKADLVATIQTETGGVPNSPILASLQYDTAPLAVANFIKLAEGTQPRIDNDTGQITTEPMYIGETFYRVINNPGFRIAQTGSGTGTNAGGPAYTFPDEFDPSVRHVPYVLSMANSGPNTNGSQIFFTGNATIGSLDDVHTILGVITDPASRTAIDTILASGNDGSSITGISIAADPGDTDAQAFDPDAQPIPSVTPIDGELFRTAANEIEFTPASPLLQGDVLSVYRSDDLSSWVAFSRIFSAYDNGPIASATIESITDERAFYHLARLHHPNAQSPSSIKGRTITLSFPTETHIYTINASGTGGTIQVNPSSGGSFNGTFTFNSLTYGVHEFNFIALTNLTLGSIPFSSLVKCGIDDSNPTQLIGHQSTSYYNYALIDPTFVPYGKGDCVVSP